jgi:hypothetical protein
MVRLLGQEYFSGPSAPRDVGEEWSHKEMQKRAINEKVKEAMAVRKAKQALKEEGETVEQEIDMGDIPDLEFSPVEEEVKSTRPTKPAQRTRRKRA